MKTYIALFRGINITGKHIIPMKDLKLLLEDLGCRNVRTYIQSGNVVLESDEAIAKLSKRIGAEVNSRFGFEPRVMILRKADLAKAIAANPFPEAASEPKSLHAFFLESAAERSRLLGLEKYKKPSERFELVGKVFYLHTPDGFGPSKLADNVERVLGVPATARNWRTVLSIWELLKR